MDQGKETHSLSSLFTHLTQEVSDLIRKEIALARTEISEKVNQIGVGVGSLAAGGMIILVGLFFIIEAAVFGLAALIQLWISEVIAAWLAPLLVGILAVVIGWVLLSKGRRDLKARNLAPQRTLDSLKRDEQLVREHVR